MDKDYLQLALATFNSDKPQWYGWRKDYTGDERMSYENLILNDSTATLPSKADVDAKIAELKQADADKVTDRTNAINKLKGATYSALTDAEAKALFGE